jgi:hypothetical protein
MFKRGFPALGGGLAAGGMVLGLWALGMAAPVSAAVMINELYYDPPGTDANHEFIELYNSGATSVSLDGYRIEWGSSSFNYKFSLPAGYLIPAGSCFLIGGSETFKDFGVTPDLLYAFNFPNGGSSTVGVRITDGAGYYDTLLYDSPNTNQLPAAEGGWDNGLFAPDVAAGHSLQRITPGVDTNQASDWYDNSKPDPTPRSQPKSVPEAGTLWLMGIGLIGMGKWLCRRRRV